MTTSCMFCGGEHSSQGCPGRDCYRTTAVLALCLLALSGCKSAASQNVTRLCVEQDSAAENADIIACVAAASPRATEDGDDVVRECRWTMRDSLCLRREWFVGENLVLCARGTAEQKRLCVDHGWKP